MSTSPSLNKELVAKIDEAIKLIGYVEGAIYSPKCEDVREVLRELRAAQASALPVEGADRLHAQIMNLPCRDDKAAGSSINHELAYKQGHRDARHAAAELAIVGTPSKEGAGQVEAAECDLPPAGWHCTRGKGHEGPCAAVLMEGVNKEWCKAHPGGAAYIINTLAKQIDDATPPASPSEGGGEPPTDGEILHMWDTRVGDPTQKYPLTTKDILQFGRAVLSLSPSRGEAVDAERYRYLRACNSGSLVVVQILGAGDDDQVVLTEADADAAIDSAIQSQGGAPK